MTDEVKVAMLVALPATILQVTQFLTTWRRERRADKRMDLAEELSLKDHRENRRLIDSTQEKLQRLESAVQPWIPKARRQGESAPRLDNPIR